MKHIHPMDPSQISVDIKPNSNEVNIFGTTRTCSQHSLSGNLILNLPSIPDKQLVIQSLSVTFQGCCQYSDNDGRQSSYRLAHTSHQLIKRSNPQVLKNESKYNLKFNSEFDLRLPGWLPPSLSLPSSRTSYSLFAKLEAQLQPLGFNPRRSSLIWPLNSIKKLNIHANECQIFITRHRNPDFRHRVHNIKSQCPSHDSKFFKPVKIGIKTPMWYFVDDDDLKLDVFTGLVHDQNGEEANDCEAKLESLQLGCVEEIHYTSEPRQRYLQTYPLPQPQPPIYPLIPHANQYPDSSSLNEFAASLGITTIPITYSRSRLIARGVGPPPATAAFATHNFGDGGVDIGGKLTARIALTLPMPSKIEKNNNDLLNNSSPYPDCETPFVKIRHALRLILNIVRKGKNDIEWRGESIDITIPVWFSRRSTDTQLELQSQRMAELKEKGRISISTLPAYNQLYTDGGDELESEDGPPTYMRKPKDDEETILGGLMTTTTTPNSLSRRVNVPNRLQLQEYRYSSLGINSPISPDILSTQVQSQPDINLRTSSLNF